MNFCASSMVSTPPTNPIRVFIDASVLFAASFSATGSARDLILVATRGDLELIASSFVLEETRRNLSSKAPRALPAFHAFQAAEVIRIVDPDATQVRRAAEVVVLKDAPVVAGAIEAKASYLASYDRKHLLGQAAAIKANFDITVDTPDSILADELNE
jgi:predicted nucleic acid-binding protein